MTETLVQSAAVMGGHDGADRCHRDQACGPRDRVVDR